MEVIMTPEKIIAVVSRYEEFLLSQKIPKIRIDMLRKGPFTPPELLAHAHYLIDGIRGYVIEEGRWGKTNRHLASIQMALWGAGVYSLDEIMNHNRL